MIDFVDIDRLIDIVIWQGGRGVGEKCPIFFKRSIIIKDAVKGSGVVVWEREDYLAEAKKQLGNKKVFQELRGDVEGPLKKIIKKVIRKLRNRGDSSHETLDYFSVNNLKQFTP